MCIWIRFRHPGCGHPARGTSRPTPYVEYCDRVLAAWAAGPFPGVCLSVRANIREEWAEREYCDTCIQRGVELFRAKGLDPDIYARSLGASLAQLVRCYPDWEY